MQLIKIGDVEINPDQIKFIAQRDNGGCDIVFMGDVIYVAYDSVAYLDLQMFITFSRLHYGNGDAHEEKESAQSSQTKENSNEGV